MIHPGTIPSTLRRRELVYLGGAGLFAATIVMAGAASPTHTRAALTVAAIWLVVGLGLALPEALLFVLLPWLVVLGSARRIASLAFPAGHADPFLLIAPTAVAVLFLASVARHGLTVRTTLAKAALVLALLALLETVNPAQGGVATGAAGLLFLLVPIAGFWIGRVFCDDRVFARVLALVAVAGVFEALYGLGQTFLGFPSWDAAWIRDNGYASLSVNGVTRAFGSFASASEYAAFLAIGLVVAVAFGARLGRVWVALPLAGLFAVALLYASVRGVMFLVPVALVLMLAARTRRPLAFSLALAGAAILIVPTLVGRLAPENGTGSGALIKHQVAGLQHPLSGSSSTLSLHAALVWDGLKTAVHDPLGMGTGAVTLAGQKFGGEALNTEADVSNAAVALGAAGVIAYVVLLGAGMRAAYSLAAHRRDALSLIALGLLVVTFMQWLNGGQYAVALLVWLTLGWIDRARETDRSVEA
jgi:hypothetical protein